MEAPSAPQEDLDDFGNALVVASRKASKSVALPWHRNCVDAQCEHLRAIRRRAERRARKTQDSADWATAKRMQEYVHRHLDRLGRANYRRFCSTLDPRKPLSRVWKIAKCRRTPPQQNYSFRALALYQQRPEDHIADAFCELTTRSSVGQASVSSTPKPVPPAAHEVLGLRVSLQELDNCLKFCEAHLFPWTGWSNLFIISAPCSPCSDPTACFYNTSWESGKVPPIWKSGKIVPLLKPGKFPIDLSSCRPITLASCVRKIMERMILVRFEWFLELNNSYPDIMSSFRRGHCAVDSIIDLITTVQQQRAQRRICGAVFLDIKGAFDNVTDDAILTALEDLGLGGRLHSWISTT